MEISDNIVQEFQENGFTIIRNFYTEEQVAMLKSATKKVVDKYCQDIPLEIFSAHISSRNRSNYFAESGDKIRGFYEERAVKDGKVIIPEKEKALNKIGHALHTFEKEFRDVTLSPQVKHVVEKLTKMVKPTVIQSMVIFKQPKVGGEVKPHQDASYLYTDPAPGSLLGFWIALDEANLENGCLHFYPESQKPGKVYQRFIKNPDETATEPFVYTGDAVPGVPREKLVAAQVKPGDLVLIDGLVIHQSEHNSSDKPRLAYTFHIVDMNAAYSSANWLQPTDVGTFEAL